MKNFLSSSPLLGITGIAVLCLLICNTVESHKQDGFVFVVLNQANKLHSDATVKLTAEIDMQAKQLSLICHIHVAEHDWPGVASWTYFPILERIKQLHGENSSWVIILEEWSHVRLTNLHQLLGKFRSSEAVFLGQSLYDETETIIHHFDTVHEERPFLFPDVRAGFALSTTLVLRLAERWSDFSLRPTMDFTIDAPYEFARFVESGGTVLSHHNGFCLEDGEHCAVVFSPERKCEYAVRKDAIHFAVKTCSKFHEERLPILKSTWLKKVPNYALYSDIEDSTLGTVSLGIPNTERGHCGKTVAVIRKAAKLPSLQWLAIVDDDTLLSINKLKLLLSCYNPYDPVALGEKYGFHATSQHGYDYITGGGGMIFSIALVKRLAEPSVCDCPSIDTPDDMFLGMCLKRLSIPVVHSRAFHQGRPVDYPVKLLKYETVVSFHKFWMINPLQVYSKWLASPDLENHEEL